VPSLMILVAGPYRSGTNDDPVLIQKNVDAMTEASLELFRAGHLPVMGEWYALPLIEHGGSQAVGDPVFNEIFHPISRRLVAKCDAVLRIGGSSAGADEMVALGRQHGKQVFLSLDEIPSPATVGSGMSAVLFVRQQEKLAEFYAAVTAARVVRADRQHSVLEFSGFRLTVQQIPAQLMPPESPGEPLQRRERGAVRLNFPIADLAHARAEARRLGGLIDERPPPWATREMNFFLAQDPEGNVFGVDVRG
jgi:hypothetical protein